MQKYNFLQRLSGKGDHLRIDDFIEQFNEKYPDVDRFDVASDDMVALFEETLGYSLPESFVKFLKEFSNGIFLLDCEPIGGVSKDSPNYIRKVNRIIPGIPNEILIVETKEWIESNRLISFTTFDGGDHSNNHWVFLCQDGVLGHEYRVGFVSQIEPRIVKVLDNFEEWLTIFWKHNREEADRAYPVFYILIPSYDVRMETLYDWFD